MRALLLMAPLQVGKAFPQKLFRLPVGTTPHLHRLSLAEFCLVVVMLFVALQATELAHIDLAAELSPSIGPLALA